MASSIEPGGGSPEHTFTDRDQLHFEELEFYDGVLRKRKRESISYCRYMQSKICALKTSFKSRLAMEKLGDRAPASYKREDLSAHDVREFNTHLLKAERSYPRVSRFVRELRDWYIQENISAERPPKLPLVLRPIGGEVLSVIQTCGSELPFEEKILEEYLREIKISRALNRDEILRIVSEVKETALADLGSIVSSRTVLIYTIERLSALGVHVLKPTQIDLLEDSEVRFLGEIGNIYQAHPSIFWKVQALFDGE